MNYFDKNKHHIGNIFYEERVLNDEIRRFQREIDSYFSDEYTRKRYGEYLKNPA